MIETAATANAPKVHGIRRPKPRMPLMFFSWAATNTAPAQKNSVIFPTAWVAMCIPPPTAPDALARNAPRVMYPSWLTVEYANRRFRLSWYIATIDAARMLKPAR